MGCFHFSLNLSTPRFDRNFFTFHDVVTFTQTEQILGNLTWGWRSLSITKIAPEKSNMCATIRFTQKSFRSRFYNQCFIRSNANALSSKALYHLQLFLPPSTWNVSHRVSFIMFHHLLHTLKKKIWTCRMYFLSSRMTIFLSFFLVGLKI